jgi:predicted NUDIX family phosphoesterase
MSARDIWESGRADGIFSDNLAGVTPWQTLKSKLSVHIRTGGDSSIFVRTAPGRFFLRDMIDSSEHQLFDAPQFKPPPSHERVVVFPAASLITLGQFQGVRRAYERRLAVLLAPENLVVMDRSQAETVDDYKQVLVYVTIRRGRKYLAYRRGAYSLADRMLRGADCIGFGGHVNEGDIDLFSESPAGIMQAAARELIEEVDMPREDVERIQRGDGLTVKGVLNDDSSAVGRRHFAILIEYRTSRDPSWDSPSKGEKSINKLRWVDPGHETLQLESYEYWSQLVLREFEPAAIRRQSAFRLVRRLPLRPPHLLAVVGQIGSGKTEASSVLRDDFGYGVVNAGEQVAKLINLPPIPSTPRSRFQEAANEFIHSRHGPRMLADALVGEASRIPGGRVLVDGVRQLATLDQLRIEAASRSIRLGILFVSTAPDVAFSFYRQRESRRADMLAFLRVRDAEVEREVPLMLERADAVLFNWSGKDEYRATVHALLAAIG